MIPLPSLTGGRSREHSRLAKASVENIIIINVSGTKTVLQATIVKMFNQMCKKVTNNCLYDYRQLGCGISLKVGSKKQDCLPKLNITKGNQ